MMDITNDVAKKYHIKLGTPKCKVVSIGKGKKANIQFNEQTLEETNEYEYLGEIINNEGNLDDHMKALRGKIHAATQQIKAETGDKEFKK